MEHTEETSNLAPSPHSTERRDQAGTTRNEKVLNCLYKRPEAMFKLICFPWAGGGSTHFAKWGQDTQDLLEVHAIRLPGRESRIGEPMATDIYQIIDEITCAMLPVIQGKPFALFGHSMGAYIAFKTALHLKEKHKLEPLHLFLSSAFSPHSKVQIQIPKDNELSEEQMLHYLVDFGGTPMNFLEDKELLQQYIPIMMADVNVISRCISESPSKTILSCDLTCFLGSEDTDLAKDTEVWKDVTTGSINVHELPGDHFYLKNPANEKFIKNYITKCLEVSSLVDF
ncbi:S-acyl fatty acid synthase thioesterase, medium chain [Aotus nancymaae]|nr:S-acyl fatty acid synthase thioesterase, medium chain [Aotus nancymaae]